MTMSEQKQVMQPGFGTVTFGALTKSRRAYAEIRPRQTDRNCNHAVTASFFSSLK